MLGHGGRLHAAAAQYAIPVERWVDLSTGINPHSWPAPKPPESVWRRLPESEDGRLTAAQYYFASLDVLPIAGTQAAIQALPRLRSQCRVGVLPLSYAEHAHRWRREGHQVEPVAAEKLLSAAANMDVLVVVNPNNPTGELFESRLLLNVRATLAAHGGWLIVDEAFADVEPDVSLSAHAHLPGLIVLRSLGKFFGLAGARVGFVLAAKLLREALAESLGPWALTGPSRYIARLALVDQAWQARMRERLLQSARRLHDLLAQYTLAPSGGCALFQWVEHARAERMYEKFAKRAILTRLFATPASLRFGLPADEAQWQRLDRALTDIAGRIQ